MAEALVSTILEKLASLAKEDVTRVGVDEEVKNLTKNFELIQDVLDVAESEQMKNRDLRDWLDKLQVTFYDIEDVLEEWSRATRKLPNVSNPLKKVRSSFSSRCYSSKQPVLDAKIDLKIKDLSKKLEIFVAEKDNFNFSFPKSNSVEQQKTSSVTYLPKVCRKDYDKNAIVNHLLNESSQAPTVPIISIVGMIGIEKTTLARLVFDDDKVNTHFNNKIWVCVNKTFDEFTIAKAIFKSLKGNVVPNVDTLETLLEEIRQCLEKTKFLLVLNDVWIETPKIWELFRQHFNCGSKESRILVTTSASKTAKLIGATNMFILGNEWKSSLLLLRQIEPFRKNIAGKMLDVECWSLFYKVAFSTLTYEERKNLGHLCRKIVDTCNGLPFVVMILGSLLSLKTKIEEWESAYSEIVKLGEIEKQFPAPLLLSYNDLPSKLRKCFSYCAIFPKGSMIYKDEVIKLWMAQGYLTVEGRKDIELVGEEYFAILSMRNLFQDFEKSIYDGSIIRCKMHDTVHEFAQFLMKNECLAITDGSPLELPYTGALHVTITSQRVPTAIYNEKNLRSLVIKRKVTEGVNLSHLFDQLTCLRTLDLSDCSIEAIPGKINNLIHLRYLNLSHNAELVELPEALSELDNLQVLDVSDCYRLKKLPYSIGNLIKLRHLINHRTCLSYMPKGIKSLTRLQTLTKFVASNDQSKEKVGCFECLASLNQLEGFLSITGLGSVRDVDEMNKGHLEDKKKLYGLSLRFDGWKNDDDKRIFEGFQPPPNLEELVIKCYTGRTMPLDWIRPLPKLRILKLISCFEFESLPDLGLLSSLELLIIGNMSVKQVGNKFLGIETDDTGSSSEAFIAFPRLRYLKFCNMEEWEELTWSWSPKNVKIMPCLRYLVVDSCPKLKSLSVLGELPSLESLIIKSMNSVKRAGNEFLGTSLSSSTVYSFPKLMSLEFEDMREWEEWNVKWEQRVMPNLFYLKFHACPNLKALPDNLLHKQALQRLIINDCSILKDNYQKEMGKEWYRISHIPYIQIDGYKYVQGMRFELSNGQPLDSEKKASEKNRGKDLNPNSYVRKDQSGQ